MPGISSPGLGSGLDVNSIVTGLVNAEIQPKSLRLDQKEVGLQAKISAVGQITSVLTSFQSSLNSISTLSAFQQRQATVANEDIFTATASTKAAEGSYQIEVMDIAQNQNLASNAFSDASSVVGSGTITIEFGSYDAAKTTFTTNPNKSIENIAISNGVNTLEDIKNTINSADIGISASIISDDSGARLVITSDETGLENSLKITVSDDDLNNTDNAGLSQLVFDPVGGTTNLSETTTAQDAQVKINGLTITSSDNTLDENIEGVTIQLLQQNAGQTIDLDISLDSANATNLISNFVEEFNQVLSTIDSLSSYNSATQQGAILQGDASVRSLRSQLTRLLYEPIENVSSNYSTLIDIGITTNSNGLLEIDNTKLSDALTNNFDEVARLFARGAFVSDSLIEVESTADAVAAGVYDINLTTLNLGTDITGTIGGLSATSNDGQSLSGSGNLTGLTLEILGGSTGNRGTVTVFDGLSSKFDELIATYLGSQGSLTTKTESLNAQVADISSQRVQLQERSLRLEERYYAQFSALDTQLAALQATSTFITQQLTAFSANLNARNDQ